MKPLFFSTRGQPESDEVPQCCRTLTDALLSGYASDGGMLLPSDPKSIAESIAKWLPPNPKPSLAQVSAAVFTAIDRYEELLCLGPLEQIFESALPLDLIRFTPVPWSNFASAATPGPHVVIAEEYHGPTLAFKDVAMLQVAALLDRLLAVKRPGRKATALAATSGDTGAAVAAAFLPARCLRSIVCYPAGRVSKRQSDMMDSLATPPVGDPRDSNLVGIGSTIIAVEGATSDSLDEVMLELNSDVALKALHGVCSTNSVNIGRLIAGCAAHIYAYVSALHVTGTRPNAQDLPSVTFVLPSGGMGNTAALALASRMGLPVKLAVLGSNSNDALVDYVNKGQLVPPPGDGAKSTVAPAMDIAVPYNWERLLSLCGGSGKEVATWATTALRSVVTLPSFLRPTIATLGLDVVAYAADDAQLLAVVQEGADAVGPVVCPHTAAAVVALRQHILDTAASADIPRSSPWGDSAAVPAPTSRASDSAIVVIVATGHPFKFPEGWPKSSEPPRPTRCVVPSWAETSTVHQDPEIFGRCSAKNVVRVPLELLASTIRRALAASSSVAGADVGVPVAYPTVTLDWQPVVASDKHLLTEALCTAVDDGVTVQECRVLVSYDDCNIAVRFVSSKDPAGQLQQAVVKIHNAVDSSSREGFLLQDVALIALAEANISAPVPLHSAVFNIKLCDDVFTANSIDSLLSRYSMVSSEGNCEAAAVDRIHVMRVLRWVPGFILAEVLPQFIAKPQSLSILGTLIGHIHISFRTIPVSVTRFSHRANIWNPALTGTVLARGFNMAVPDQQMRDIVTVCLESFAEIVASNAWKSATSGVIHSDLNEQNVLITKDSESVPPERWSAEVGLGISGVIDLGDAVFGPLIIDVAHAIAYALLGMVPTDHGSNPSWWNEKTAVDIISAIFNAYKRAGGCNFGNSGVPENDANILLPAVLARLSLSLAMAYYTSSLRPDNEYVTTTVGPTLALLPRLYDLFKRRSLQSMVC